MKRAALAALAVLLVPAAVPAGTRATPVAAGDASIGAIPCGWPDPVQGEVLEQARRLMPAALQRQLWRHRRALAGGARRARRHGADRAEHLQGPLQAGGTAAALAESLARITALIDTHRPMAEVAREMGVASHLVADLSNPFRTLPGHPGAALYARRFATYLADRRDRFRVVFEGYTHPLLEDGRVTAFGMALADRSRSYLDDLIGAFRRYDANADPAALDERSVPFGVASLTYSRSVTDTARAWLHAWRRAHGDLSGLPFSLEDSSE